MKFKTFVIVHLTGIALAVLGLCFIPFEDHLRYGIGHVVCWVIVLSAIFAFFYVPRAIPLRKWIKVYFGFYLFNTCFMALYPLALVVLYAIAVCVPQGWRLMVAEDYYVQALIPKPVECENSDYIIRSWNDVRYMDNSGRFYLYKKGPLLERLITKRCAGDREYEKYQAKRILEVDEKKGILKMEVGISSFSAHDTIRYEIQEWSINETE